MEYEAKAVKVSLLSLFDAHETRRVDKSKSSESAKPCLTVHGSSTRRPATNEVSGGDEMNSAGHCSGFEAVQR